MSGFDWNSSRLILTAATLTTPPLYSQLSISLPARTGQSSGTFFVSFRYQKPGVLRPVEVVFRAVDTWPVMARVNHIKTVRELWHAPGAEGHSSGRLK